MKFKNLVLVLSQIKKKGKHMKYILPTIMFIFSCTAVSAGSHSNDYQYPKKDCEELFIAIAELLEEADKHWIVLKDMP